MEEINKRSVNYKRKEIKRTMDNERDYGQITNLVIWGFFRFRAEIVLHTNYVSISIKTIKI